MDRARFRDEGTARVAERRLRQWEIHTSQEHASAQEEAALVHPYIAISRSVGSGGRTVADLLSQTLGWDVFDKEIVEHMAADDGVRRRLYHLMDERRDNWLDAILRPIALGPGALRNDYFRRLRLAIATIASQANAIFLGRGAGLLLPPELGLHVRLIADREQRIAAYAARQNLDTLKATAEVDRIDREREQFLTGHFGSVRDEAERYDLVVNMSNFTATQAADLIESLLRQRVPLVQTDQPTAQATPDAPPGE